MWLVLAGCGFSGADGRAIDAGPDSEIPDAMVVVIPQENIDFLPAKEETFTTGDWNLGGDVALNTTDQTSDVTLPAGVTFTEGLQHDGVTKVAILRVKDLKISAARKMTVTGTLPLFILADHDVGIDGLLDVGGHGAVPGPAGGAGGTGPGAG